MNSTQHLVPERQLKKPYYLRPVVLKRLVPERLKRIRQWADQLSDTDPRFVRMAKRDPLTLLLCMAAATKTSPKYKNIREYIQNTEKEFQNAAGIEIKLCLVPGRRGAQIQVVSGLLEPSISYRRLVKYCGKVLKR